MNSDQCSLCIVPRAIFLQSWVRSISARHRQSPFFSNCEFGSSHAVAAMKQSCSCSYVLVRWRWTRLNRTAAMLVSKPQRTLLLVALAGCGYLLAMTSAFGTYAACLADCCGLEADAIGICRFVCEPNTVLVTLASHRFL